MSKEFVMDKKCIVCGRRIKVSNKERDNKFFTCGLCKENDLTKYCKCCGFLLMKNEGTYCKICIIKETC